MHRLKVNWSGSGVVGPGLSVFHFSTGASNGPDAVYDFFNAAPLLYPSTVTITVPSGGDIVDVETGALTGVWDDPGQGGTVNGTNSGDFFAGVGMRVKWLTSGIVGGRRVVGSTFLVPIAAAISDTSGTIDNSTVTSTLSAANAMLAAEPELSVWSRPTPSRPGALSQVIATAVPDKTSWLRSRRV